MRQEAPGLAAPLPVAGCLSQSVWSAGALLCGIEGARLSCRQPEPHYPDAHWQALTIPSVTAVL